MIVNPLHEGIANSLLAAQGEVTQVLVIDLIPGIDDESPRFHDVLDRLDTVLDANDQVVRDGCRVAGQVGVDRHIGVDETLLRQAHLGTSDFSAACRIRFLKAALACPVMSPISSPKKCSGQFWIWPKISI